MIQLYSFFCQKSDNLRRINREAFRTNAIPGILANNQEVDFVENEKSAAKDRPKVIVSLKKMLGVSEEKTMANYIISKETNSSIRRCDDPFFIKNVVQAMTAMKLALRMFNKI